MPQISDRSFRRHVRQHMLASWEQIQGVSQHVVIESGSQNNELVGCSDDPGDRNSHDVVSEDSSTSFVPSATEGTGTGNNSSCWSDRVSAGEVGESSCCSDTANAGEDNDSSCWSDTDNSFEGEETVAVCPGTSSVGDSGIPEQYYSLEQQSAHDGEQNLTSDLAEWAQEFFVTHKCLTGLLHKLRNQPSLSYLPRCAKTILKTPRRCTGIAEIGGGKYCHFGVASGLQHVLKNSETPHIISVAINIDGLPLTKSTKAQLWPILCHIINCKSAPFPVGLFFGHSKPHDSNEYLRPFVDDMNSVLASGVQIHGVQVPVKLAAFICDAPARAYILHIKGHNARAGCSKCCTEGEYKEGRMCYPGMNAAPRTD
ncbi:uncharacterized protein LOC135383219 [Ornithodoros turicata]|uniref:uncharacterized protein LOC135383219 n=1 Tax=Ornithodoros turicata TaxID=34597 RepID=UPI0031387912